MATGEDYVLPSCPDASVSLEPPAKAEARLRCRWPVCGGEGKPFTPVISEAKSSSGIATIFVGWMSIRDFRVQEPEGHPQMRDGPRCLRSTKRLSHRPTQ